MEDRERHTWATGGDGSSREAGLPRESCGLLVQSRNLKLQENGESYGDLLGATQKLSFL